MQRVFMLIVVVLVLGVVLLPTGGAPSSSACNLGTETAHSSIPQGVPGHDHVPECE
jgi:hypothetical protein